jgi:hypothetical protein
MKLPSAKDYDGTEWHIGSETYQVKVVKRIPGENEKTLGLCDPSEQVIYIKAGQSKSQAYRTFRHEIYHAYEAEYGIPLRHAVVYQLEKADGDFLISNFGAFADLLKAD